MVVACADFCLNVVAIQDEMDANKKKMKNWLEAQEKWMFYQAKFASPLPSSSRTKLTLVDALQLEGSAAIRSNKAKKVAEGV